MAKSVEITQYIRDRAPGVKFPGRGYVLPKAGDPALPVVYLGFIFLLVGAFVTFWAPGRRHTDSVNNEQEVQS